MTRINDLSAVSSVAAGDSFPLYSTANGDARRASATVLASFVQSVITASDDKVTQYAAPAADPFTVLINDDSDSIFLCLTPTIGVANATITLPSLANCVDKQEVLVVCTQAVGALVVNGNGATVVGAPAAIVANDFFRLRFDHVLDTWYRVG